MPNSNRTGMDNIANLIDLPMEDFVNSPEVVDFNVTYGAFFKNYIADKPYIRTGTILDGDFVVAYAPRSKMPEISSDLGLDYINIYPSVFGLLDEENLNQAGIISVHKQQNLDLLGRDVLIGFVDTGIDYTLSAFKYEDGTSKIKYIWDQTIEAQDDTESTSPPSMHFGSEYSQSEINSALETETPFEIVPHKDEVGHGTFLASVAASREPGTYIGAAPDSEIIMVKLRKARSYYLEKYYIPSWQEQAFESSDVMLGIHYINFLCRKLSA